MNSFFVTLAKMLDVEPEMIQVTQPELGEAHFEAGEHFVYAGDVPHSLGYIESGLFRLYYNQLDGNEFIKSFSAEGDFVGAYSSMLLNEPAQFNIEALEPSTLYLIAYDEMLRLYDQYPIWQVIRLRFTEMLYIKKERREAELLLDDASTRYRKFLEQYPTLEKRLKQYQIASYLGITPVSLSRIRALLVQN